MLMHKAYLSSGAVTVTLHINGDIHYTKPSKVDFSIKRTRVGLAQLGGSLNSYSVVHSTVRWGNTHTDVFRAFL